MPELRLPHLPGRALVVWHDEPNAVDGNLSSCSVAPVDIMKPRNHENTTGTKRANNSTFGSQNKRLYNDIELYIVFRYMRIGFGSRSRQQSYRTARGLPRK